jgi:putative ABC transport system substrate-binding protein
VRRRGFFGGAFLALAALALGLPCSVLAQQQGRAFRIGILSPAERSSTKVFEAFREGLRALGYIEGRNIVIEYRLAAGNAGRLPLLAADLARLPVDLIVTDGGDKVAEIAHQAAPTIPIVMATAGSPVVFGLVESLRRPGGNLTGFTLLSVELSAKRLELLREAFPAIAHITALWIARLGEQGLHATEQAARSLGVRLNAIEIAAPADISTAFETAVAAGAEALVVLPGAMFWNERARIVGLAEKYRLPAIYPEREYADDGGLLAYGPDVSDNFRRTAGYVDRILKGAKPGDLPIQQPTKFELVVNLKTAKALGRTIPQSILARADEVIE